MTNLDSILKSRDITLPTTVCSQSYVFSTSHVWMWQLDYKESWALKNWWFQIVVLQKTLENSLGYKKIKPVNLKANQPWTFIGRTDVEAESLILWPPNTKSWPIGKAPDAGKRWGKEKKGVAEDETVGWHHWLNGNEFEQTQGDGEGQGSLACCSWWGCKELETIKQLNNSNDPLL